MAQATISLLDVITNVVLADEPKQAHTDGIVQFNHTVHASYVTSISCS